jgi:non-specific serine/threonine protein kinase
MALAPGTSVGPYVIVEFIDAGGMGEVYRARDSRLEREVAVKVLAAAHSSDPERLQRFEREARAAAALTHPNILTIFDVGAQDGAPFLVSELLEGQSLRQRLAAGSLPFEQAVDLALQLARGAAAAHAVKIVHRDLKPENLFLTRGGILKILDFGLAKLRPAAFLDPEGPTLDATQPGRLLGTPSYMAPEQLRGEPADERADVFAIGVTLYEMLGGLNPFRRKTGVETAAAILREPPAALPALDLPAGLERVVLRCLEKEPSDRFQTASEVAAALESLPRGAKGEPAATPVPTAAEEVRSIAVLPFADMSPTRDQDYLCEGLAEELINALTHVDGLRVAARSSSFQFRGAAADVRAVGEQLGVATVLEGSVRKAGDRLRVTVQLVDVASGFQRWSRRYDRGLEDVFAIQDEIAESVATALRGVLSRAEKRALHRPETAVESYEYYLRGRQLLHKLRRPDLELARQMFERAIDLDAGYAPAFAGLAAVHSTLYEWMGARDEDKDAADRASRRALELAPDLAESHVARGLSFSLGGRYDDAAREFEESIRINPNLYDAHYYYGRSCFASGDVARSVDLFRRASQVREEDFQSLSLLGQSLDMLGRTAETREAYQEAVRRAERLLELSPYDARVLSLGANSLFEVGRREEALRWSERALELYPDEQTVLINVACTRAKAGLKEGALDLLERAFSRGWGKRDWIERDPDYDSLRDDPRFQKLLAMLR